MTRSLVRRCTPIEGWSFHPDSGLPKHGPTLDKPQTKAWFAYGSWWAALVVPIGAVRPDLAIYELVDEDLAWRNSGTVIASDPLTTADALFDGERLWVATRAPGVGIALHQFEFDPLRREWHENEKGYWHQQAVETPSISVACSDDGSVWVMYAHSGLPFVATGAIKAFPELDEPISVPGASATLWAVDLGALIPVDGGMGVCWSDQGSETFHFAVALLDGTWRAEIAASGGRVADDHIALRSHAGCIYAAVKTSKNDVPTCTPDEPLILLLVRESGGTWHQHDVVSVVEPVTRPILLIDPEANEIHVLYTFGPNPGERSIRVKSASLGTLEFAPGPGDAVLVEPGAEINDVTGAREPLTRERGSVLLASDGKNGRYYFCRVS